MKNVHDEYPPAPLIDTSERRDESLTGAMRQEALSRHKILALCAEITRLKARIPALEARALQLEAEGTAVKAALISATQQADALNRALIEQEKLIHSILTSKSWRLTQPLRSALRLTQAAASKLRGPLARVVRAIWRRAPLSTRLRQRIKGFLFRSFPKVFERSNAYQVWKGLDMLRHEVSNMGSGCAGAASGSEYVPLLLDKPLSGKPCKVICFYLPQFHAIPENDAWWGTGFTEWTNVQPARPQFVGHHQPHVPGELGYYNLLDPAVFKRQIELAKLYGVEGFCFYFYWFGGKRLLDAPLELLLADRTLDLPFCLCWANENWSRRWDGKESEILIAQAHSPDDDLAFIEHVARFMRDPRYIRIDGKPLLLVYRPSLLPSPRETVQRWRQWCRGHGLGEVYLAYTQSFEIEDPAHYGFDAAIEFPPNLSSPPDLTDKVKPLDQDFSGKVFDWTALARRSEHYTAPPYKLFRSVCPSWDNTARRKNRGTVFVNSTPALYQQWLGNAIRDTVKNRASPDERLVFVNAWNEWAEGAHLEPDARYGYAFLQATRNALAGHERGAPSDTRKIVLVSHDAYPHGAQLLALNLARTLSSDLGFEVDMVCLGDGPLKAEYARWARLHDLTGHDARGKEAQALAQRLFDAGHRHALVNTTVSGHFLETLARQGLECVALVHELRGVIDQSKLHPQALAMATHAKALVFPATEVAASFAGVAPTDPARQVIRPQGLYKRRRASADPSRERQQLRQQLNLPPDSQIVLGVGYADHRKGVDLFVDAGLAMAGRLPDARWVWIGHWSDDMRRLVEQKLTASPELEPRFIFPGLQSDTEVFYGGSDVFALTSREDPFPSVVLEAMDAGLPVVGFEEAGGFTGLLREGCGQLVAKEDPVAFGEAVARFLEQPEHRRAIGSRGQELIAERYSFRHYLFDLLDVLGLGLDRISVVVPNYNYEHYLPERLNSILRQDYPVFEILFLDDKSKDGSLERARQILSDQPIDFRIIPNAENSGSVFRQWKKGADLAQGTHVWIAEADDACSENFLREARRGFRTPGVVLSYCESRQIDENGALLAANYQAYVSDVDPRHWLTPFVMDGPQEAAESFSIKNVIPNVSGVLFEAKSLRAVLDEHIDTITGYRVAGDWLVYVLMMERGRIAFSPVPANAHRRHQNSVTLGSFNAAQLQEIRAVQAHVATHFAVPPEKAAAANAYAEQLAEQFGLAQR